MPAEPQTLRLGGRDYPVSGLSEAGRRTLEDYQRVEAHLLHLRNMTAILNKARNAYIADLRQEIVRGKTGLDLGALFSD